MLGLKKKNKKESGPEKKQEDFSSDLIVHNMPPASRPLTAAAASKKISPAAGSSPGLKPRNDFKLAGILVIAGGAVFIAVLFYLSYIFIIKPTAKKNVPANNVPVVSSPVAPTAGPEEVVNNPVPGEDNPAITLGTATATEVSVATATIMETTSSSTASSSLTEELIPLVDSDNDGINDEEEAVFGSDPKLADTNNNSYSDLTEILNNYNPTGSGRLGANANLAAFSSQSLGYSLLVPKVWPVKSLNNDSTVLFTAPDESLIQISLQDNTNKQSILSWYGDSFPADSVTYDRLKSAPTWDGVMAADGFNFYLTDKKRKSVFIISYIPASDDRVVYPNVFKMIVNSFSLK